MTDLDHAEFLRGVGAIIRDALEPLKADSAALVKRIEELEGRPTIRGEDGKSVTVDDVSPMILEAVKSAVEAIPVPQDGKDADPEMIKELVAEAVAQIQVPSDGKDAEPVLVADVVAELVKTDVLAPVLDMYVAEAVSKHFEANPVRHGNDGARGPRGEPGADGAKGADGKDGVGLAGAMIDRDGSLVVTLTNGETKSLGPVVGKDGANGKDGLSVTDMVRQYDADAHEVVERWVVDGETKELRYPAGGIRPGAFWREGMKSLACQAVTHDGALWIAKRDNSTKPCLENADDWQLAARKGRDGRDGKDGKAPPGPVKLESGNA